MRHHAEGSEEGRDRRGARVHVGAPEEVGKVRWFALGVRGRKFGLDPLGIVEQCFELLDCHCQSDVSRRCPCSIM